ncbi:Glucan endo-1,3-beta-glucosidase A1, partial [Tetrabaena socialis]
MKSCVCAILFCAILAAGELRLRWKDEFSPCEGVGCSNGLSMETWNFEEGDGSKYGAFMTGWGNQEMQCYTNRSENVVVRKQAGGARGVLVIRAQFNETGLQCSNAGAPSSVRYWSSARITTRGKAAFMWANQTTPVKIEARVKFPTELGAWAAFWALPDTPRTDCLACGTYGDGWCSSGEIDILETANKDAKIHSTIHYGGTRSAAWLECKQRT